MSAFRPPARLDAAYTRLLARLARRRAVVLGYHGVAARRTGSDPWRLNVTVAAFQRHLTLLAAAGFRFVTVAELVRRAGGAAPPPGLAAVSFDDGMRNNLTVALPVLQRLGIPATVYVASGLIGGQSPWVRGSEGAMLSAAEVCRLAEAGWEIGAHTVTHADLSTLGYDECLDEIATGRDALAALTGRPVDTFAYPFGRYGADAVRAVRTAGLLGAVTTGSGTWEPYELTRAMVSTGDPLPLLGLKLVDGYEPLLATAPLRTARSAGRTVRGALAH